MSDLELQYRNCLPLAEKLSEVVYEQLNELLDQRKVTLAVPIDGRVKTWDSISEKIQRKELGLSRIDEINDLVGLRAILLFRSELKDVDDIIRTNFDVIESTDTAERLSETQFGYQSQHYIVRLPRNWLEIPTFAGLGDMKVEVQVRTMVQHVWAEASHKLQYKHESSVPVPLRRTIHRVAALLETVDLEFDRVLVERTQYREVEVPSTSPTASLNVELLPSILDKYLPAENKMPEEDFAAILRDLSHFDVKTVADLCALLEKHRDAYLESERNEVHKRLKGGYHFGGTKERIQSGVFFAHIGLVREAIRKEFGEEAMDSYMTDKK